MGSPLEQHFVLAALQSGFLPLTFRNPVHQRSPIVVWTCHQNSHSDRPSQRRIEHFTWCLTHEHILLPCHILFMPVHHQSLVFYLFHSVLLVCCTSPSPFFAFITEFPLTQTMHYQKTEGVESLQIYSLSRWKLRTNPYGPPNPRSPPTQYSAANGNSG